MKQPNESVEDGTEGGYTVIDPSAFPDGYIEALIEKYRDVSELQ
jgi:hypothetical protein